MFYFCRELQLHDISKFSVVSDTNECCITAWIGVMPNVLSRKSKLNSTFHKLHVVRPRSVVVCWSKLWLLGSTMAELMFFQCTRALPPCHGP